MRTVYRFEAQLNDGLVRLRSSRYGTQLWTLGKLRRMKPCARCGKPCAVGSKAYSPLTNRYNRMDRLHEDCVVVLRAISEQHAAQAPKARTASSRRRP